MKTKVTEKTREKDEKISSLEEEIKGLNQKLENRVHFDIFKSFARILFELFEISNSPVHLRISVLGDWKSTSVKESIDLES